MAVYVREAHPTDGWRSPGNDRAGISFLQPKTKTDREAIAAKCCSTLQITMPMVIDDMTDSAGHLYSGMPDRLYLIDRDGRVAYKGGRGPFGFKSGELEQSLLMLLMDQAELVPAPSPRVSILDDGEARRKLPPVAGESRSGDRDSPPLPVWARMLAGPLPNTTAAMLHLDYLHRAKSPLDSVLRGEVRWMAAHMNRCAYSEAYAAADLHRAGLDDGAVAALAGDLTKLPEMERAALTFARKMTLDAVSVTDAEMARLLALFGEKRTVALVQLLAYANFQDRLLLALDAQVEPGGPLPPVDFQVAKGPPVAAPERPQPVDRAAASFSGLVNDSEWTALEFPELQKVMEAQRARAPRIAVPPWDTVRKALPAGVTPDKPVRIKWSLVCAGYQPELAMAWSACTRAFAQDAKQDRVFEELLFWVVTRSLQCFY